MLRIILDIAVVVTNLVDIVLILRNNRNKKKMLQINMMKGKIK